MGRSTLRRRSFKEKRALVACSRCRHLKKSCKQVRPVGLDVCQRCLRSGNDCLYVEVANDRTAPCSNVSGSQASATGPDSLPITPSSQLPPAFSYAGFSLSSEQSHAPIVYNLDVTNEPTAPHSNASSSQAPETAPDSLPITPSDLPPQTFDIYTEVPFPSEQPCAPIVYHPGGPTLNLSNVTAHTIAPSTSRHDGDSGDFLDEPLPFNLCNAMFYFNSGVYNAVSSTPPPPPFTPLEAPPQQDLTEPMHQHPNLRHVTTIPMDSFPYTDYGTGSVPNPSSVLDNPIFSPTTPTHLSFSQLFDPMQPPSDSPVAADFEASPYDLLCFFCSVGACPLHSHEDGCHSDSDHES